MKYMPSQIQHIMTESIKGYGLGKFMEMVFNCLMKLERKDFLLMNNDSSNKANGYRFGNAIGFGKMLKLEIPRDRLGNFYPILFTPIRNQEEELANLAFNLYSKGLSVRDVSDIFDNIYGKHYSKSSISRMNQEFIEEVEQWRNRPLQKHYPILVIDALHSNIRRDNSVEMEATYTIIAVQEDMSRDIIAIEHIPIESSSGWEEVFQKLKDRGVKTAGLIIADGLPGLENSIPKVFPAAKFQKCVVHFKRNILRKVRAKHKVEIAADLKNIFSVTDPTFTYKDAKDRFKLFEDKWGKSYKFIKNLTNSISTEYYFTYLIFDYRIRSMIYTTNWVENLNKQYRRVLKIRNSMPTEESVLLLLGKVAMDKVHKYRNYPIYKFKFDKYLFPQKDTNV